VKSWKFDRALHAQYGGVVIFQQSNPVEPVGAYRKWLEEHEQAGHFQILDDEARVAFWEYFKRDWDREICVVHDADPLAEPWWLNRTEEGAARLDAALSGDVAGLDKYKPKTFRVVGIMSDSDRDVVATGLTAEMAEATAEYVVRTKLRDEAVVEPDPNK
jgi:hypothetical protein